MFIIISIPHKFQIKNLSLKKRDLIFSGGPGGIRTPEAEAKDLQSSPFDRSGTDPDFGL